MAWRALSVVRSSVRSGWIARGYANGTSVLPLTFSSPTQAFYDKAEVSQVDVSTTTGSFGILPDHVPVIAVLKPGVVTVYGQAGKTDKYFASSGSVTVNADSSVQILAEEAVPLDQLDASAARQCLEKCMQQASAAGSEADKAEAQVGIELYETILKAVEG